MKNHGFHSGINRISYEVLFGCNMVSVLLVRSDVIGGVTTEKHLENFLGFRFSDDESPNNADESHPDIENAGHKDTSTSGEEELCCVCLKGTVET